MATHKVEDIRNVAFVGHGAAGKTTLADALLFHAKAVDRNARARSKEITAVLCGESLSRFHECQEILFISARCPFTRISGQKPY